MASSIATTQDNSIGTVRYETATTVFVDVTAQTPYLSSADSNTEYVVRLNGRMVRRLSSFQAERFGLIPSSDSRY